jgi:hypothetical protein
MKCPAELYLASPRPYDGLPELTYPFHDRDLLVTARGRLCLHRKRINISTVLAGQRLGIKEVDDGIWLVSFMHYDLGYFDLEQKTLQPLDNPFGPRLSPHVLGTICHPCVRVGHEQYGGGSGTGIQHSLLLWAPTCLRRGQDGAAMGRVWRHH